MCEKRISSLWGWIILVVIVVLVGPVTASAKVIYVDGDASFGGNGQNWATSYRYLQDALAVAVSGDEIKVAEGIYKPDRGGGNTLGNRYATFQLKNGVVITGGYAGFGEPQPDAWDIDVYETLLSGDLLANDGPDFANNGDNSYHVVTGSGTNVTAVLDGLTITGGNANVGSDITAGIISHWKFDEDQGSIAYDSAGNNHGIVYGAQWTTGQIDGALNFDGFNDYVMIPNESYFDITDRITLAVWIKVNSLDRGWQAIITKGDWAWRLQRDRENNVIEFALTWIPPEGGYGNIVGHGNINDGRWHHICGTYDGAHIRLYMDGVEDSASPAAYNGGISTNNYNVLIGENAQLPGRYWNGLIDDVRIYVRALSAGEVQELYSMSDNRNYGGGMYNESGSPTITNCTFSNNSGGAGGGMFNLMSNSTVTNCTFSGNSAGLDGGGMYNKSNSNSTITNCTFSGNSAGGDGGGMYNYESSSPTVTNCTLSGNSAVLRGGGIANFGDSNPTLANCILWGNTASEPQIYRDATSWVTVSYSDVQGGWPGIDNIITNPLFVDPAIGDYRLLLGSPCIDAGDNSAVPPSVVTDLDGNPRIIDGTVDMGAYEGPYQGFVLSAELVIVPEGGSATFTVMLAADPLETVEVATTVESGDPDITVEAGGLLTFDSTNYSQPQTVTLTAAHDADQLHGTTVILVSAPGVYPAGVTAYELDSEGQTVLYVDCDARGANDGSSWENAFTDLREGLSFAEATFWIREIRVAQGAYTPEGPLPGIGRATNPNPTDGAIGISTTADLSWTAGPDATSHDVFFGTTSPPPFIQNQTGTTFDPGTMAYFTTYYWCIDELKNGSRTAGTIWSFTTFSVPPPMGSNESLVTTLTVLDRTATFQLKSGVIIKGGYAGVSEPDPNDRDVDTYKTILSGDLLGNDGPVFTNNYENSYHVVTSNDCDETAVLDGFIITAGNANGQRLPVWQNCGGGMLNKGESSPSLTNCIFMGNSADRDGGAMFNTEHCNPILTGCTFIGNSAIYDGGAICNRMANPTVSDCEFTDNSANHGGGISNWPGDPAVFNCKFTRNSAELGGAVFNAASSPEMINCLFTGNSAREWGGAVGNYNGSSPVLTNCILWNNKPEQIYVGQDDNAWLTYCDVQGGWTGPGNIDADPCFVEMGNLDLLAYYKFDEADGTTAYDSVGINHGIVHGARWTSGKINGALDFDGYSDYVEVPGITNPINMTYMLWVRVHSHNGMWNTLIEFANDAPWFGIIGTGHVELYSCVTSAQTISIGHWYHLAVISDGYGSIIYINGQPEATTGLSNTSTGTGLGIGYHSGDTPFDGLIDDVMIFRRPLPAAEIEQLYQNGLSGQDYPDVKKPDYHLLPGSPCINAGDPDYIAGPNETDLDGKPRIIGGRIDIGPYEFNHIPIADAGQDRTVEAQAPWGATATFDGSASSDADSTPGTTDDIKEFNWFEIDPCDPNADVFLGSGRIIDCNLSIGDHVIVLDVIDRAGAYDSNEVTIIVQDTTPPGFTNIPQDLAVECDGGYNQDQLNAWLACATATDKCSNVTITNDFSGIVNSCGATGSTTVTWTAEDEYGNKAATPPVTFTIVDTVPPLIACPPDVTLEYPADTSAQANGSATAGDTCGSTTITHNDVWQPGCGNTKTIERTWIATDDCNNSSSCTQVIKVVDTTPPGFQFSVSPTTLWPPSHKMVEITPNWTVTDECDPEPEVSLVGIVMSEGDDAVGDGHTTGDIEIGEDGKIYVRSERSGANSGRIYTITYQAVDDCGNVTLKSATVSIPHDFKVLAKIADRWLLSGREGSIHVDFNNDGIVNLADFARFAENWIK